MTEQLYFDDPFKLEFSADVAETFPLPEGKTGAIMPGTYFYPTSGGQEHDTGMIGDANVVEVYKEEERIVHVLDRNLAPGHYPARIDRDRRLRAMQHHTGQHILSAAFLRVLDVESVSANINAYTPTTVDLDIPDLKPEDLHRVEDAVNEIIFENRPVKSYIITDADVPNIPFRKPPKVSGNVRVIEVEDYDYTPCGGTHCLSTGTIGLLKILRTERVNQKTRVHFVAGLQALEVFRIYQDATQQSAFLLNSRPEELAESVHRLLDASSQTRSELEILRLSQLDYEAKALADSNEAVGEVRLVIRTFGARAPSELRVLATKLKEFNGMVSVLASNDGQKVSLIVSCASGSGVNARNLLNQLLGPVGGRGGGDASLAQGGGPASAESLAATLAQTRKYILPSN
jgi:alanyl-tRNA synthetase